MRKRELKFACNSTLGKLSKYLRALGIDTIYLRELDTENPTKQIGDRVLLTRNRSLIDLAKLGVEMELLTTEKPLLQLRHILEKFRPRIRPYTRCMECNTVLIPKDKSDAKGKVPFFVYQKYEEFYYCPNCNKYYWEGTHKVAMEKKFKGLLGDLYYELREEKVYGDKR